jgi:hypothetical protein
LSFQPLAFSLPVGALRAKKSQNELKIKFSERTECRLSEKRIFTSRSNLFALPLRPQINCAFRIAQRRLLRP